LSGPKWIKFGHRTIIGVPSVVLHFK